MIELEKLLQEGIKDLITLIDLRTKASQAKDQELIDIIDGRK